MGNVSGKTGAGVRAKDKDRGIGTGTWGQGIRRQGTRGLLLEMEMEDIIPSAHHPFTILTAGYLHVGYYVPEVCTSPGHWLLVIFQVRNIVP